MLGCILYQLHPYAVAWTINTFHIAIGICQGPHFVTLTFAIILDQVWTPLACMGSVRTVRDCGLSQLLHVLNAYLVP